MTDELQTINKAVVDFPSTLFDGWNTQNPSTELCMLAHYRGGARHFMGQLWHDSCDLGMSITNPKTGKRTFWYLSSVDEHMGETAGWRLKPTNATKRRHPAVANMELIVVND